MCRKSKYIQILMDFKIKKWEQITMILNFLKAIFK